jgi:hypothetical protein
MEQNDFHRHGKSTGYKRIHATFLPVSGHSRLIAFQLISDKKRAGERGLVVRRASKIE